MDYFVGLNYAVYPMSNNSGNILQTITTLPPLDTIYFFISKFRRKCQNISLPLVKYIVNRKTVSFKNLFFAINK